MNLKRTTKNWMAGCTYSIAIGLLAGIPPKGVAQEPATILEIQAQNAVTYIDDVADPSMLVSSPGIVRSTARNFTRWIFIGDIVSANGKAAKGVALSRGTNVTLRPSATPGQAIADTLRQDAQDFRFEIQQPDGTPIGTIMASGFSSGTAAPGAPLRATGGNNAITGGTGAFLGVRGQQVGLGGSQRIASMIEDPANRRTNGGGSNVFLLQLIPMTRPEVATSASGPAVFHADFSPVNAAKPAKAGEVLIMKATGLGPTVPGVDPGQPFPTDAAQQVNSPVDVTVNGLISRDNQQNRMAGISGHLPG
jgi:uncharacterized protein (TIGR03437 family)